MLCAAAPEYNTTNEINNTKKPNLNNGKLVSNENEKKPLLKNLSLAFASDNNKNGSIIIDNNSVHQINESNIIKEQSNNVKKGTNNTKESEMVDLPLANGNNSFINSQDISRISYEDIPSHSKLNMSISSIRPNDNLNGSSSSLDKPIRSSSYSEDESFIYNSHLSEIDRNEDIKDLRIKLKKAIKSLDKKKKDLTLAAVIGQCLLEANTNLKTLNYKLMNHENDKSSISGSYYMNSEVDPSFSSNVNNNNKKSKGKNNNNNVRVYTGVGRQEKDHLNLFPDNGSLDETYNSVVEYHEENYNKLIKKLTDINNQLENNNMDLRRQVNDLEEVVKDTKNKYNRGLLESETKLNEMENKLHAMTELNNKLFKDNNDLMKEFNSNNNYKTNEIKQEQKLIDSLYNELYDMQHKIEEINSSKEKCEKKFEKLNMEYIKSQGEIDELKKVQEQNKLIEQINNEQENRIQELHEYMEYQRDYISRLENQLFFCTFNPVQHQKLSNNKIINQDDIIDNRIVELTDDDEDNDNDNNENNSSDDEITNSNSNNSSIDTSSNDNENENENDSIENNSDAIQEQAMTSGTNSRETEEDGSNNNMRNQNSQLVLYSPNIFQQILSNISNTSNLNQGNNVIDINMEDNHNNKDVNGGQNNENNNPNAKKRISINDVNDINLRLNNNSKKRASINGNVVNFQDKKANTKKKISINGNGDIIKQVKMNDNNNLDFLDNNDIKRKRRASANNILTRDTKRFSINNDKPRRKSLNVAQIPSNQFIYSFGNPMFDSNKLIKSSEDSTNRDSSDQDNEESLNKFQQDIKKMFKPRPPVKKMKMNKHEKKMVKKIKMDKLNDIIQTSEKSITYTPSSSSYIMIPRNSSFNSLSSSSLQNSYIEDSREFFTSHNISEEFHQFIQNESNSNHNNNNNNNNSSSSSSSNSGYNQENDKANSNNKRVSIASQKDKKKSLLNDNNKKDKNIKALIKYNNDNDNKANNDININIKNKSSNNIDNINIINNTNNTKGINGNNVINGKRISSLSTTNIIKQPSFPVMTNHYHDDTTTTTTDTSFIKNVREHYPYHKRMHEVNPIMKPPKRTFRSIFLKNPFSTNFNSPSTSSWTSSSTTSSSSHKHGNRKHGKDNHNHSNLLKSSSSTTLDLNSSDLDLSTQIIIRNESEINNSMNSAMENNIKTSEILWNKENNKKSIAQINSPENNNNNNNNNIVNRDKEEDEDDEENNNPNNLIVRSNSQNQGRPPSEEVNKNRNKVAKFLIKGWIHVVDGMSIFNPYHINYENDHPRHSSSTTSNDKDQNDKAVVPYDPDRFRLPTTHFWNSYY